MISTRRIIDPAFEGGRLKQIFPAMKAASEAAIKRIEPGILEVEELASFAAVDVIFRTLFLVPIEDKIAGDISMNSGAINASNRL